MFIVVEAQVNADKTVGVIPTAYENENQAKSKYHTVLSAAAISSVPIHTAFLLTDDGYAISSECFRHEVESEEQE